MTGSSTSEKVAMELAKKKIDVGLSTNNLDPMLHFWQNDVGLRLDHVLPVRRGQKQYRHDAAGSVIKINHHVDQLPVAPPTGYRELIIARQDRAEPERLTDPDGNRTCLVPLGHEGINQIAVRLSVRNLEAHRRFYADALGLVEEAITGGAAFRAGESLIILEERPDTRLMPGGTERDGGTSPSRSSKLTKFMLEHLQLAPGRVSHPPRSEMLHEFP